jgi:hypothetical protein
MQIDKILNRMATDAAVARSMCHSRDEQQLQSALSESQQQQRDPSALPASLPRSMPCPKMPCNRASQVHHPDQPIVLKAALLSATPWVPGSEGFYPRPRGVQRPGAMVVTFLIWNLHEKSKGWQQAMFQAADRIDGSQGLSLTTRYPPQIPTTLYLAADIWVLKKGTDWGLGKIFGAFRSPTDFVHQSYTSP